MTRDLVPYDEDAERTVLAAMILSSEHTATALRTLSARDFYVVRHAQVVATLTRLHRDGRHTGGDCIGLAAATRTDGTDIGAADLIDLMATGGWWSPECARTVLRTSVARAVLGASRRITADAEAAVMDPDELVDSATAAFAGIDTPGAADRRLDDLATVSDYVTATDASPEPWVIPGLLRRGWRAVIVASEGAGKTWVLRMLAVAAAQGVHPLQHGPIPPVRSLIVDLENPRDAIAASLSVIDSAAQAASTDYDETRAWIYPRPGGMDLRTRSDRLDLEALISATRPDLVCLGPVYKMYRAGKGESDELAAGEAQGVLDDLRTRYGFALVLEHHAPKGSISGRDMLPHGTALWLRWPELGLKLVRSDHAGGALDVGRWREDRVQCTWPVRLERSRTGWPWLGVYDQRMEHA